MITDMTDRSAGVSGAERAALEPGAPRAQPHVDWAAAGAGRERVDQMYRRYRPMIYRRCLRLLHDREEARDVTHDVFVKLLQELGKAGASALSIRWVHRVTTNHCINVLRESARTRRDPAELRHDTLPTPGAPEATAVQLVRAVLAHFDGETQSVALAVFVQEIEYAEIAARLGVSSRTVARRVDRFLLNARKFLARP